MNRAAANYGVGPNIVKCANTMAKSVAASLQDSVRKMGWSRPAGFTHVIESAICSAVKEGKGVSHCAGYQRYDCLVKVHRIAQHDDKGGWHAHVVLYALDGLHGCVEQLTTTRRLRAAARQATQQTIEVLVHEVVTEPERERFEAARVLAEMGASWGEVIAELDL